MRSLELAVDVTSVGPTGEPLHEAVTVHLPDDPGPGLPVVFAYPGATYSRRYYDLALPGVMDESYSQARHHTEAGFVVVACDHLGTGESTSPADPFLLEPELLAAANAAVAEEIAGRLASGTLAPGVPALEPSARIGIGQSMGGCLLTVQQARHRSFDAVGILGWSGRHTTFPDPDGGRVVLEVPDRRADLRTAQVAVTFTPEQIDYCFHHEEEPGPVRQADRAGTPWRSAGVPPCALVMLGAGAVAEEAAAIEVPVFVAAGERDVVGDPHAEALAYRASPDVTVTVFGAMAHMHNFAGSRRALWDRLAGWVRSLGLPG